ncbi:DUF368 domain-containing protein [Marinicella rhabdoformis]|uniref:DUF368 domain-containing protein n=1 Tax=Marinicella rhabdoformis TaxID=2580566 RepID=UPI0012AED071|nr:DUF368 domain-containing protein [Marinicella rhabdoformis]
MIYLFTYLKGMMMGVADLVPGVSGGTIALIVGIYQRLITALASVNGETFKQLFTGQFKAFWRQIDGWFLLSVFAGMVTSILVFASLIKYLLASQAIPTWSFFFGLIVASAVLLLSQQKKGPIFHLLFLLLGIALSYLLSTQVGEVLPSGLLGVFMAGAIAICAMILPGLSGSLILLLLGKYEVLLQAVSDKNYMVLLVFAFGCLIGLLVFSKVLKWLMSNFYRAMIFFLSGLMLGTLIKVWPWKVAATNVMPMATEQPQLAMAISMMVLAATVVWLLAKFDSKKVVRKKMER